MKTLFILIFLGISLMVSAATYYVSNSGNDANSGTSESSPFATISKVNSKFSTLQPGDQVLFKRGDTFYGTLVITRSGAENNKIVCGAYGTGEMPIISGFTTVTGWTNESGGIYSKVVSAETRPNMLTINDVSYVLGRYPKTGWLTIDAVVQDVSITDAALPTSYNWTGADVVIRKNRWIVDKHLILSHSNTTLSYANPTYYKPRVGWGYFIQNSLGTLTAFGDWCYNTSNSKLYVYFGAVNPDEYKVKVSTLDRCVSSNGYDYIEFNNLDFQGANVTSIYSANLAQFVTVDNCKIRFSGKDGIVFPYSTSVTISNSTVSYIHNNAITLSGGSNAIISANYISNIAVASGMGANDDGNYNGIIVTGNNSLVEFNTILTVGYIPINYKGTNTIVRNNYIDTYGFVKDDGAGIYTYYNNSYPTPDAATGKQVLNNVVLNAIGSSGGTNTGESSSNGIYVDGFASHVLIDGNTVGYISNAAIHMNGDKDITITNNTFFKVKKFISMQKFSGVGPSLTDITITNNIFVSAIIKNGIIYNDDDGNTSVAAFIQSVKDIGNIDYNYYYSNEECLATVIQSGSKYENAPYTIKRWADVFGYDVHSVVLPKFPEYKINSLGVNRVTNSTFNTNISGWINSAGSANPINWESSAGLDNGCIRTVNGIASFIYSSNHIYSLLSGSTSNSKNYILRLIGKSTQKEKTIGVLLETNSTPYLRSYYAKFFSLGDTSTVKEILIRNPIQDGNYLKLLGRDDNASIYFDNVGVYEAEVDIIDPMNNFQFEYTDGLSKTITLTKPMIDVKGVKYTNSITLSPYSSIILMNEIIPDTIGVSVFSTKNDKWDISVYPNPAQKYINISKLETSSEPQTVRIYNLLGELCLENTLNQDAVNQIQINLMPGLYILQVRKGSLIMGVQKINII